MAPKGGSKGKKGSSKGDKGGGKVRFLHRVALMTAPALPSEDRMRTAVRDERVRNSIDFLFKSSDHSNTVVPSEFLLSLLQLTFGHVCFS